MPLSFGTRYFIAVFASFPPYYKLQPVESSACLPNFFFNNGFNIFLCVFQVVTLFKFNTKLSVVLLSHTVPAITLIPFGLMKINIFCES